MNLRNLIIHDTDVADKDMVIDGIKELEAVINDNYQNFLEREIAIEFNIASRLGEPREYLIVYSNPDYSNNPYIFIFDKNTNELLKETTLETFRDLADLDNRQNVNHTIYIGFKNLPKYAFLGVGHIETARKLAKGIDNAK